MKKASQVFDYDKEYNMTPSLHGGALFKEDHNKFRLCGTVPTYEDLPDPYDGDNCDVYMAEDNHKKYWYNDGTWETLTDGTVVTNLDATPSTTSHNPIENQAITNYINDQIDAVEAGSIEEANEYTDDSIALEAQARSDADDNLQTAIQNLASALGADTAVRDVVWDATNRKLTVTTGTSSSTVDTEYVISPGTCDRGLSLDPNTNYIGHSSTTIPQTDLTAYKITVDQYGHVTGSSAMNKMTMRFYVSDDDYYEKVVWVES